MRLLLSIFMLSATSLLAQGRTLIVFEKGEVTPSLATSVERSGHGQYKLMIPSKPGVPRPDKIKQQLEKDMKTFKGLKISAESDHVTINFQGPDTPLLQALSRIEILP